MTATVTIDRLDDGSVEHRASFYAHVAYEGDAADAIYTIDYSDGSEDAAHFPPDWLPQARQNLVPRARSGAIAAAVKKIIDSYFTPAEKELLRGRGRLPLTPEIIRKQERVVALLNAVKEASQS